ncbi:unnamed protein product [Vitrella brassicaformis CCMP3155]|uniref:PUM-HD domain-containing protein n=2 Tax=Vitrella brassicaformis TaxID=1169539 RepID=A0A0G4H6J8_VITBC|nr:unnamed protein product [Vitrella brassicaformis CCMP3155]|eukprot:CEM39495.1 unnamed protein product [Vitrella brassicaformis CCMP3155]
MYSVCPADRGISTQVPAASSATEGLQHRQGPAGDGLVATASPHHATDSSTPLHHHHPFTSTTTQEPAHLTSGKLTQRLESGCCVEESGTDPADPERRPTSAQSTHYSDKTSTSVSEDPMHSAGAGGGPGELHDSFRHGHGPVNNKPDVHTHTHTQANPNNTNTTTSSGGGQQPDQHQHPPYSSPFHHHSRHASLPGFGWHTNGSTTNEPTNNNVTEESEMVDSRGGGAGDDGTAAAGGAWSTTSHHAQRHHLPPPPPPPPDNHHPPNSPNPPRDHPAVGGGGGGEGRGRASFQSPHAHELSYGLGVSPYPIGRSSSALGHVSGSGGGGPTSPGPPRPPVASPLRRRAQTPEVPKYIRDIFGQASNHVNLTPVHHRGKGHVERDEECAEEGEGDGDGEEEEEEEEEIMALTNLQDNERHDSEASLSLSIPPSSSFILHKDAPGAEGADLSHSSGPVVRAASADILHPSNSAHQFPHTMGHTYHPRHKYPLPLIRHGQGQEDGTASSTHTPYAAHPSHPHSHSHTHHQQQGFVSSFGPGGGHHDHDSSLARLHCSPVLPRSVAHVDHPLSSSMSPDGREAITGLPRIPFTTEEHPAPPPHHHHQQQHHHQLQDDVHEHALVHGHGGTTVITSIRDKNGEHKMLEPPVAVLPLNVRSLTHPHAHAQAPTMSMGMTMGGGGCVTDSVANASSTPSPIDGTTHANGTTAAPLSLQQRRGTGRIYGPGRAASESSGGGSSMSGCGGTGRGGRCVGDNSGNSGSGPSSRFFTPKSRDTYEGAPDLSGRVMELSKIQSGSRYLQRQLCKGHPETVMLILSEVEENLTTLMTDSYGNYLCQQLFQACSIRQRKNMLEKLRPNATRIAKDRRGTHALQSLIGLLSTAEEEVMLIDTLRDHLVELASDCNGTHVVQRMLICFTEQGVDEVFHQIRNNITEVAQSPYGLCVVKKCITLATEGSRFHQAMLHTLCTHAMHLVQSPYGNYAVQHAMDHWPEDAVRRILHCFRGKMLSLSIQKFSSNVVEKCIEKADPALRAEFVGELIKPDKMAVLIQSSYGNYVVQKALELSDPEQAKAIQKAINKNLKTLQNHRLRTKWERIMHSAYKYIGEASPSVLSNSHQDDPHIQQQQQQLRMGPMGAPSMGMGGGMPHHPVPPPAMAFFPPPAAPAPAGAPGGGGAGGGGGAPMNPQPMDHQETYPNTSLATPTYAPTPTPSPPTPASLQVHPMALAGPGPPHNQQHHHPTSRPPFVHPPPPSSSGPSGAQVAPGPPQPDMANPSPQQHQQGYPPSFSIAQGQQDGQRRFLYGQSANFYVPNGPPAPPFVLSAINVRGPGGVMPYGGRQGSYGAAYMHTAGQGAGEGGPQHQQQQQQQQGGGGSSSSGGGPLMSPEQYQVYYNQQMQQIQQMHQPMQPPPPPLPPTMMGMQPPPPANATAAAAAGVVNLMQQHHQYQQHQWGYDGDGGQQQQQQQQGSQGSLDQQHVVGQ